MPIAFFNSDELLKSFNSLEINKTNAKNIVIHSAIGRLGVSKDETSKEIFQKIINYFNPGKTLFFPTFSYSYRRGLIYNPSIIEKTIKNEMGVLSYEAIKSQLGVRTYCPIFSYYVIGNDSHDYKHQKDIDCFSEKNIFGRFFSESTLFIGIGITYSNGMSPFMYLEKLAKVPYRKNLHLKGQIILPNSKKIIENEVIHFARDEINFPNLKMNRDIVGREMENLNIAKHTYLNNGLIYSIEGFKFKDYVTKRLKEDPFCMVKKGV